MSWELAVVTATFGIACLFFWLSKSYDNEHAMLKLFLQLLGYVNVLVTVMVASFVIPSANTELTNLFTTIFFVAVIVTILIVTYWLFYIGGKLAVGELKLAIRNIKKNDKELRRVSRK